LYLSSICDAIRLPISISLFSLNSDVSMMIVFASSSDLVMSCIVFSPKFRSNIPLLFISWSWISSFSNCISLLLITASVPSWNFICSVSFSSSIEGIHSFLYVL